MVLQAMTYKLKSYGLTDVGHIRENNEDVWAALPEYRFFVLADGMGGHRAGEIAAEEAVNALCTIIKTAHEAGRSPLQFDEAHGMILLAIEEANVQVFNKSMSDPAYFGMGTTLCCLYFHPQGLIYGHVGDSRIYRLRQGKLEPLTRDHSLIGELIDKGHLSKQESEECGFKNVITKAIGTDSYIEPSVHMVDIQSEDTYIMCTDGLTDMLSQDDIEKIANKYPTIEKITQALIDAAKAKGGHDNITVVIVQVQS